MSNYVNPQSECILLNVDIQNDYKNQYTFTSKNEQETFFKSKSINNGQFTKLTFIKDGEIAVEGQVYDIYNANYLMFQNKGFNNKWFYAFITDMEYENQNCTKIHYELDVFQTWYFDIHFKDSFIIRKHVTDDSIGANTIDENLNIGEVVCEEIIHESSLNSEFYVAVSSNYMPTGATQGNGKDYAGITIYNKQVFGGWVFIFPYETYGVSDDGETVPLENLEKFLLRVNLDNKIDSISNIFIVPGTLINKNQLTRHAFGWTSEETSKMGYFYQLPFSYTSKNLDINISKLYSFDNFVPKNNKLYCYPYNYLFVTNNSGNQNIYKYEDFYSNDANFKIDVALSVGVSGRCFPLNYKGITENIDEMIPLGKYPTCSWSSDSYINWLTQQAINIPSEIASIASSTSLGIVSGNVVGATMGIGVASKQIGELIGGFYKASLLPNTQNGSNTSDVNFSSGTNTFYFYKMHAKIEYLKIIDNYFSAYGYQVNTIETPNLRSRQNWNYIETKNVNIIGDIPNDHLTKIKNIFDKGITLWHNDNVGNYNRANPVR